MEENNNIYQDISVRTGGNIYIGVVGPVRTGKSTFIKKFMDTLVIPNITDERKKTRTIDELPQSAGGRTIMTTEPKFIPEESIEVVLENGISFKTRVIDCVGYIVPSALGHIENKVPRMVTTPWFKHQIPFDKAAEIGTKKVITDHSTIGLVVTTDGTISDIDRSEYEEAEARVIEELKELNKPFITLLNSIEPYSEENKILVEQLEKKYSIKVIPVNCMDLTEKEIKSIISQVLYEFPIQEVKLDIPKWLINLGKDHWLKSKIYESIKNSAYKAKKIRDAKKISDELDSCEFVSNSKIKKTDLGTGTTKIKTILEPNLFYKILAEKTGIEISGECQLMEHMLTLTGLKNKYERIAAAYDDVEETGYGIVMPVMNELKLEEPEIIKQGGKYGIRLKACAPSIHMLKTNISTEITPIVGSERQSEELVMYLLGEFESNPNKIWESNIFGKSLHELVNEGLHNKLYRMPSDAREKIKHTVEKIINEGCNGLICIIL
ncbi:MAG: stage IV sporulation protein A [Candidatus Improbicoccus pseudotrichonymphae]|uniref:Stage IV sporulation protein A n=1 Tax=Candidatus Improbicoccus pseudotrichonymphae TaxID=3033792 RepID=A0AA48L158_9FIRM|nr:MAG: stage IV sporulation protein A [Candidatus Improbicoccus pseudotrichonymphae]